MRRKFRFLVALTLAVSANFAMLNAQVVNGNVTYYFPKTTLSVTIDAEVQTFTAGPYAKYADQYFDSPAQLQNSSKCMVKSISVIPSVVPDYSQVNEAAFNTKNNYIETLLFLDKQGMIFFTAVPELSSKSSEIALPAPEPSFAKKGLDINSITKTTTTYKSVETEEGFIDVPETTSEEIALNQDMKAEELANVIRDLKQSRIDIITGNTDAEFSGEAMSAVVKEIRRSTDEFFSMFYGVENSYEVRSGFDIVPDKANNQIVICRISDTKGILPADSKEGRPVVMTLTPEPVKDNVNVNNSESIIKNAGGIHVKYKVPASTTVKISDGSTVLFERQFQMFQFGATNVIPM